MSQPKTNRQVAAELLASVRSAAGTASTIAYAQAYATLAVADELAALRAAVGQRAAAGSGAESGSSVDHRGVPPGYGG